MLPEPIECFFLNINVITMWFQGMVKTEMIRTASPFKTFLNLANRFNLRLRRKQMIF